MKTNVTSFLVAKLLKMKQKIGDLTNDFISMVKNKLEHDETVMEFDVKNEEWNSYSNMQKVRWQLVLLIVVPVLILVDYASLKIFIEYLQYAAGSYTVSRVLKVVGILIFFILELAVCFSIVRLNERLEKEPNRTLKFIKIILMTVMITLPSILIYTGYVLYDSPIQGDAVKTFALILLSLAIHTALFILIDDVLKAITYIVFLVHRQLLKGSDPMKKIERVKKQLLHLYPEYGLAYTTLGEFPDATIYIPSITLGKRELTLREKLEDGLDEEDYEELINMKSHKPPTTGATPTAIPTSSSTVW